jgi:hypothetical protein
MPPKKDGFSAFDEILSGTLSDPWTRVADERPSYNPDYELLRQLLTVPVTALASSQSGDLAGSVDAWVAQELRRAAFEEDSVWPRRTRPRVLPHDLSVLLSRLPAREREALRARIATISAVAPVDAKILGRAYVKQVDVVIARWDRGPELMVSTKTQVSSFAKNLPNRFEESYGDAGNLRGRYPLAALGFFFVQRSTVVTAEPAAFEFACDMIRKLRDDGERNGYTATGLLLVDWNDVAPHDVRPRPDLVPHDIRPEQFLATLIRHVLSVTPVTHHVAVRELMEGRSLAVEELDEQAT